MTANVGMAATASNANDSAPAPRVVTGVPPGDGEPARLTRVLPAALVAAQQQLEQARQCRAEAHRTADRIVAAARAQAAEIEATARARVEAAVAAAAAAARREATAEFAAATATVVAAEQRLRAEYTAALPAVALRLASHVLGSTLTAQPEWFAHVVADVAAAAVGAARLRVRVHPDWLARTGAELEAALAQATAAEVALVGDAELAADAVSVETDAGDFTTSVAARLQALTAHLDPRSR